MVFRTTLVALLCLVAAGATAVPAHAADNCTTSQTAAIECFVANAVTTDLTKPRHGMTLPEFEAYGVAVSQILQTRHTYLVIVGISSAVSDAMPPTNQNGSSNPVAQQRAITYLVTAASEAGFLPIPAETTIQHLKYFALDSVAAMNDNNDFLQLLTPGVSFRIVDSYLVTATKNGVVNWSEVESGLSSAIKNFISSGLMKLPPGVTETQVLSFGNALSHIIYNYKVATGRTALN
jgi:hypothetical protein